jgi:hypothetical protein
MFSKLGLVGGPAVYYAYSTINASCDAGSAPNKNIEPSKVQDNEESKEKGFEEMKDLEKIFQENPYAAADPEEMERILNARSKNKARKPPQFAKLMIPIKMLST